ncbi:MAG: regulatory protein RecX [Flavobacteriales bacterium]
MSIEKQWRKKRRNKNFNSLHLQKMTSVPKYSADIARLKMIQWCNKAERCHWDVREKLIAWNIRQADREIIIAHLIETNLLNEQRYAEAFVNDKFRLNKWGTKKIQQQLKMKGISERNIHEALKRIEKEENTKTIQDLIKKKEPHLKGLQLYQKKIKLARYLISKGFENDAVWRELESE